MKITTSQVLGEGKTPLSVFDDALIKAGSDNYNLTYQVESWGFL